MEIDALTEWSEPLALRSDSPDAQVGRPCANDDELAQATRILNEALAANPHDDRLRALDEGLKAN